jgi:3-phosphoshikimate 1-carboxyvinyltransferase
MARFLCQPGGAVGGEITVPGDKSVSHRSLMLGGLATGDTEVTGFLESEDCLATMAALQDMGVRIERLEHSRLIVHGPGKGALRAPPGRLDMGNAGTAMRLMMGLLAPQPFNATLVGDASLMRRPMERVAGPLRLMGANITTHEGKPPVEIRGNPHLKGIEYTLPMASAQVKSAVLLAGLGAEGRTRVNEDAPTRDHTERMLSAFGVKITREQGSVALEGGQPLRGTHIDVPGDFSSAAFFLVAGCLAAKQPLTIRGVGVNPTRTGLLDLLRLMGADIRVHERKARGAEPIADLEVHASALNGIEVPETLVPLAIDEFPILFIAAACARGETVLRGAHELRVKESDRLAVMAEGLGKLGVEHELLPDGIRIQGGAGFRGGRIDSHGDHRIAMSFAVASLRANATVEIEDVANVATSFPGFVPTARQAGLAVEQR